MVVNNNGYVAGYHAGMMMFSPTGFELYDPNGSFHFPGISEGSLRVFPVDIAETEKIRSIVKAYLDYQVDDGNDIYLYKFSSISKNDFLIIQSRIYEQIGCYGVFNCSLCISNALTGVGIFKNLEPDIRFPSNLKRALDKIGPSERIGVKERAAGS